MMAVLKTWCLLPLAALLLLSIVPTAAEVVRSMSDCAEFLLQQTPPQIPGILEEGEILDQNRYRPICQTWMNTRRFVTLYDTKNKIPVFSAYKYRGKHVEDPKEGRGKHPWKTEPQLETEDKNMRVGPLRYNHQAVDNDYNKRTAFNRGHLFPSNYGFTKDDKIATFTLTNTVPQERRFNSGSWNRMETCVKCVMDKYCINNNEILEGFLVTGAQPSTNNLLNKKVNIPSMLWSAFCCYSHSENKWLASAHWGDNNGDTNSMPTKTLAELHKKLSTGDTVFEVFPGTCPRETTVTELYPKLDKTCLCPLPISTSAPPTTTSAPLSALSTCLRSHCTSEPVFVNHFGGFEKLCLTACRSETLRSRYLIQRCCFIFSARRHNKRLYYGS
ncbi:endonuclease domain-containing 1 protein-like [Micropterus dolomieu]|uniref:endonuclease domain-containing 1 protein-like n=1 Tax=Micropterus dolomieu TaxID=147949 RepID=UPI001E8D07A5|nr:endonuclease domain-containing 1 protein-like [Micropterus dolomieu]